MMIILLYSAAILIVTSLLVNYLRLWLVEVRLPEPCSSLVSLGILGQVWYLIVSIPDLCTLSYFVKHLNIFHGNINNKSFER